MDRSELESKHLAELHALAAEAGVERYRMLPRAELIEKLAGGGSNGAPRGGGRESGRRRQRGGEGRPRRDRPERKSREQRKPRQQRKPRPEPAAGTEEKPEPQRREPAPAAPAATSERPKRKRRRRWGRRRKGGIRVHDLLLPPAAGGRAIVYGESREACTALLRELASELAGESKGPDPIALLIDPSPEELADWKREAPRAEILSAGQARHADDALAQAARRAGAGEDVIVLIDSLTRFGAAFAGPEEARGLFDAGLGATGGTLTVVAALERQA